MEAWPRTALAKAPKGLDDDAPSGAQLFWPVMRWRIAIFDASFHRTDAFDGAGSVVLRDLLRSPAARAVRLQVTERRRASVAWRVRRAVSVRPDKTSEPDVERLRYPVVVNTFFPLPSSR